MAQEGASNINEESRRYPSRPFLGVGALIFDGDRLLIVERGKEPLKGYWSIPGGIVEVGEKLEEGIRREGAILELSARRQAA